MGFLAPCLYGNRDHLPPPRFRRIWRSGPCRGFAAERTPYLVQGLGTRMGKCSRHLELSCSRSCSRLADSAVPKGLRRKVFAWASSCISSITVSCAVLETVTPLCQGDCPLDCSPSHLQFLVRAVFSPSSPRPLLHRSRRSSLTVPLLRSRPIIGREPRSRRR